MRTKKASHGNGHGEPGSYVPVTFEQITRDVEELSLIIHNPPQNKKVDVIGLRIRINELLGRPLNYGLDC